MNSSQLTRFAGYFILVQKLRTHKITSYFPTHCIICYFLVLFTIFGYLYLFTKLAKCKRIPTLFFSEILKSTFDFLLLYSSSTIRRERVTSFVAERVCFFLSKPISLQVASLEHTSPQSTRRTPI